jgi:hypothetical protein
VGTDFGDLILRSAKKRVPLSLLALPAVLALGACSMMPDMDSFRAPRPETIFRPLSVSNVKEKVLPPVPAGDLVDTSGNCANAYAAPAQSAGDQPGGPAPVPAPEAGVSLNPTPIALEMSECDVVKRAGVPERTEIGANERNERTATLTYSVGSRPGIYSFVEGRLKSMERGPEPPPQPKVAKKPAKQPAKPKPRQATVQVQ